MATSRETYCLCGQPYNVGQFMIECDWCREWFHGSCVDVKIYHSEDIDKYHCPKCAQIYGPSIMKIPQNTHRHDRYELHSEDLPIQSGTPAWITALVSRPEPPPPPISAAVISLPPAAFTETYIKENGFNRPIFFSSSEGLDMRIPHPSTFSVQSVLHYCGADLQVEVIDVRRQSSVRMSLKEFVEYYEMPYANRDGKVLNVLSLEFSDTPMSKLVWAPYIARSLDWARRCWPRTGDVEDDEFDGEMRSPQLHYNDIKNETGQGKPRLNVQKYCLMSAAGSYTDFHVDFGGTTVWYHVLKGRKIFYLIPPTATNLALYQQWNSSATQNQCFFGDLVDWYTSSELKPGQTMFIPTGWIHAVYTPEDSLVFGGNFLHSYGIELQLQVNEIESRIETPTMFRYPLFETMHWYAGVHLLQIVKRVNEDTQDEDFTLKEDVERSSAINNLIAAELPPHLLRGIRILAAALKEWNSLKSTDESKRNNIPTDVNSGQLVRDLTRELRRLQRLRPTPRPSPRPVPSQISRNPLVQKLNQNKPPKLLQEDVSKKLMKLTLPRPIMQSQIPDPNIFQPKSTPYTSSGYDSQGSQDSFESTPYIVNSQSAFDSIPMTDIVKKTDSGSVLRIKFGNMSGSTVLQPVDMPYGMPHDEHSILKSHLTSKAKPSNQWTISKKECEDDQTVLFTNEAITIPKRVVQTKDVVISNQAAILAGQESEEYTAFIDRKTINILPEYSTAAYEQTQLKMEPIVYSPENSQYIPAEEKIHVRPTYGANGSFQLDSKNDLNQSAMIYSYAKSRFKNDENLYGGSQKIEPSLPEYAQSPYGAADNVEESMRLGPAFTSTPTTGLQQSDRRRSSRAPRRRPLSPSYHYDVTDGDLCIDEDRPARRRNKGASSNAAKKSPLKMRIPAHLYKQPPDQVQYAHHQMPPANGIESLLQASALAAESANQECEAVEGMLSISQFPPSYNEAVQRTSVHSSSNSSSIPKSGVNSSHDIATTNKGTFGLATITSPIKSDRTPRRPASQIIRTESPEIADPDEEANLIKEVHRDEEFVYPSLELSSDDEDFVGPGSGGNSRSRNRLGHDRISKHDKDESWSPRARLGRLLPKMNRPVRPGVRREAVRKALQAAATTNTSPPTPAIHTTHIQVKKPIKRKPPPRPVQPVSPPTPIITSPGNNNSKAAASRMKKGMKTVKQRLGKILKLHKMIY